MKMMYKNSYLIAASVEYERDGERIVETFQVRVTGIDINAAERWGKKLICDGLDDPKIVTVKTTDEGIY